MTNVRLLAATLRLVIEDVQPERLWLMANSMGGQVVVDAFSLLSRDTDFSDAETEIENVMLTAPDVDHDSRIPWRRCRGLAD